ncbi:Uncharacterised protein [Salmonella enterica subsp. enterica serovar Bovismorbificans]|uniref:Uncharacterized protein n=1 Tax=Salmonella enterica subsp. enterica serovar Bovismorbificans TaxID=58097 RepID=A0A655DI42_SALET|nr:Uncharacterised protein [Salmonella enterica subsp. enterica serovar Bovismorbificans]CNU68404.1 Uncharacterised protein [Salmonella enterica subsp. enterica serovar Bovismorbificans]CPR49830.1 Uncharacterised protein [Salmonella enterica subsp. enterica serovar Bovismorbificans]
MLPEIRPSSSPISANRRVSFNGLPQCSFIATSAATTEQALDPNPEPIGIFFSSVIATGMVFPNAWQKRSQH